MLRDRMREDLRAAMKARDAVRTSALRTALAAIDNAEAVPAETRHARTEASEHVAGATAGLGSAEVARRRLDDAETAAIVAAQADERTQAAETYEGLGRDDEAARLRREAAVLRDYVSTWNA